MLLYAIYTPREITQWNKERLFAFASVERFVATLNCADRDEGTLEPITHDEAMLFSSLAILNPEETGKGVTISTARNAVQDSWDGSWKEIHLVERIEDERIPSNVTYP